MTIAFSVNSAGDCEAGTYGWNAGDFAAGVAMGPDISMRFLLQSSFACENVEQSAVARAGGPPER